MTDQTQQNDNPDKTANGRQASPIEEPSAKRQRVEEPTSAEAPAEQNGAAQTGATTQENGAPKKLDDRDNRDKGYAPIKKEYALLPYQILPLMANRV